MKVFSLLFASGILFMGSLGYADVKLSFPAKSTVADNENSRHPQLSNPGNTDSYIRPIADLDLQSEYAVELAAAHILSLYAERIGNTITLYFNANKANREITILRSPKPINSDSGVENAVSIGRSSGNSVQMTDTPLAGFHWYYAAVDSELIKTGHPRWMNYAAFSEAVTIPAITGKDTIDKTDPLSAVTGSNIPSSKQKIEDNSAMSRVLSGESDHNADIFKVIDSLLAPMKQEYLPAAEPEILEIDGKYSGNLHQRKLQSIIKGSFANQNWVMAESELQELALMVGIDTDISLRVQFYLGQSLYFGNRLQEALLSFVVASEGYYAESRHWMTHIYNKLKTAF